MIGRTFSHYRIVEKLGEGGMGVVYRAEDTKLKRMVALKFLPPELTRDPEAKERFIQEAQAASALDHPNICTIYEVDETKDGHLFIAMACYEGETLKQKIARGPLGVEESLEIALQAARGLERAHEAGIVHRDIKPANVMITDRGEVKIVDFGLAKLAGQARLTKIGTTTGTAAYMSPEQARGEEVDRRTDIWSLGAVLYEMLTGRPPFQGEHEAAMLYSIVHEKAPALSSLRPGVPAPLVSLMSKILRKNPALRHQTIKELIGDLETRAVQSVRPRRHEKSIVVLPFENLSPDPDQEYFSDGLTEEVISDLSSVRALRVISRISAMTFKGTKKRVPEIAQELDVQYVLEGSVRKAGSNLRITAQLIDAANDAHLWSEKYAGTMDDVFDVQEQVSRSIVNALKLELSPEENRRIAERPIDNVAAYQCYLRANAAVWRFDAGSLESARANLEEALDILGDNALLYATMGAVYFQYANLGVAQEDHIAKAEAFVRKALKLDPDIPQAHSILAIMAASFYGDLPECMRQLKMALAANPNDVEALKYSVMMHLVSAGKYDAASSLMEKLREINPLDPWNWGCRGFFHIMNGQYERALEAWRHCNRLEPENPGFRFFYAWALTYTGNLEEAFSVIDRNAQTAPNNVLAKFGLLLKYALLEDKEEAFRIMTPDFRKTCRRDHQWSYFVALPLALLNETDESLDWLENAVDRGFINYPELERDRYFDNLRGENRFKKLLERVKYEWEHFEA